MAAQRHPFPSDGGAGAARVGAGGSSGHVTAPRAMPKASPPYASEYVRAHVANETVSAPGDEAAEDMRSRQRTIAFMPHTTSRQVVPALFVQRDVEADLFLLFVHAQAHGHGDALEDRVAQHRAVDHGEAHALELDPELQAEIGDAAETAE